MFAIFRDVSVVLSGRICVRDTAKGTLHGGRICKGRRTLFMSSMGGHRQLGAPMASESKQIQIFDPLPAQMDH